MDWSPYFAGYTIDGLLVSAMTGALLFVPLLLARASMRLAGDAIDFLRRIIG